MSVEAEKQLHLAIDHLGLRAHATAVGFIQLTSELVRAGVLETGALDRIKDAIVKDLCLSRPRIMPREQFARATRERLDLIFSGERSLDRDPAAIIAGT